MVSWILIWLSGSHKSGEMTSIVLRLKSQTVSRALCTGTLSQCPDTSWMTNDNYWDRNTYC